jgi:hypothetical protein
MNFHTFLFNIVDVDIFALNLVKVKKNWLSKNKYPLYFGTDEIFSLAGERDDIVCFIFIYNVMIWWAFRGVILCYPLANLYYLYLCGELSMSVVLKYHMMALLFSRGREGARDWYVFIGQLLLIDLKNCWPGQNWIPQLMKEFQN